MKKVLPLLAAALAVAALVVALLVVQRAGRRPAGELSGTIEAREINVSTLLGARVLEVRCEEGQSVATGDTLVLLDPTDYRSALLAAEAAASGIAARSELALSTLRRLEALRESGGISAGELDRARAEANAAGDALAAANAQADVARKRVADCTVLAPAAGNVSTVVFRAGETAYPGVALLSIVQLEQVWLTVYVPEPLLGRVRLGDSADVRIDAWPDRTFRGRIAFISDKAEFTPRDIPTREERVNQVYRTKIELANPDGVLKPGMPADAVLTLR
ncbi:MAG: efflux RND transporter periplasmic adaptor subunit [bacterium]